MNTKKFPQYREYRESGIEWLGRIPTEWNLWKLSHAFGEIGSGTTPPSDSNEWYGGGIPWVTTGELREREIFATAKTVTALALKKYPTLRVYPKGSIAIAMYGATIGRLGVLGVEATTNQACCVLPGSRSVDNTYLYYWFQAFRDDIVNLASGGGQPNISQAVVSALRISAPEKVEQTKIAKFLDYETAKIDALIEKQKQLIALLKEKRQAVISHAVTKGLNPDAPMRNSGVEWLGEVPAHWEVKQIRYVTSQLGGGTPSKSDESYWGGDIPWVSPKDMKVDYISNSQDSITEEAVVHSSTKLIPVGSVLIVVRGMILDHSVPTALTTAPVTINQDMKALVPSRQLDGEFLLFVLKGIRDYLLSHTDSSAHGTKCMSTERLERTSIAIPGIDDQQALVTELKTRLNRIDTLNDSANKVADLLQERRTALISAAVTGKIDVRNWKAPDSRTACTKEVAG